LYNLSSTKPGILFTDALFYVGHHTIERKKMDSFVSLPSIEALFNPKHCVGVFFVLPALLSCGTDCLVQTTPRMDEQTFHDQFIRNELRQKKVARRVKIGIFLI
jgi:hypothetical protein